MRERKERPSAEITPAVTVDSKPQRVADRDHELTALELFGISQRGAGQIARRPYSQKREIGVWVDAERASIHDAALRVLHAHLFGALDHVRIGEDKAVRRDDHAGSNAARAALVIANLHAHHGRADGVGHGGDGVGVGVEDFGIGGGCHRLADVPDIGRRSKIKHWLFGVLWNVT